MSADATGQDAAITPARLATWSQQAKRLSDLIQRARWALATGKEEADPSLLQAQELAQQHQRDTKTAAGIYAQTEEPSVPVSLDGPVSGSYQDSASGVLSGLAQLAALDTPESRALLRSLETALRYAEQVDAQRGHCVGENVPLLPGESRGTDYAETLSELILRLSMEIHGPMAGRGRE